jgi:uncharacterized protein
MKRVFPLPLALCFLFNLLVVNNSSAQTNADAALAAEIAKIRIIDNHAHPLRFVAEGAPPDDEFDALPVDNMEPFTLPLRMRPDNPEWIEAWRALFGYKYDDMTQAHVRELMEAKRAVLRQQGEQYPSWVLDRVGIEVMFANRIAMGRGLPPTRFRWVSFVDALIFPLNNEGLKRANPDRAGFFPGEERLLKRYLKEAGIAALPATFEEYLKRVITPTLERQKREGAVAVKFEAAYLRALDFDEAAAEDAGRIYLQYAGGVKPPANEYKTLQDYLFRYVAREAGRLGLAVHIHTGGGAGGYFNITGSNPALLESAFNDPTLRKTNFVMIHGGWPFPLQAASLLDKPNVYLDYSAQTFLLYPRALSSSIRSYLEFAPDKVMFGTDAFAFGPEVGWEEVAWTTTKAGREALALALTGMMNDKEITRERAVEIARMVLRDNARALYGLK